MVDTSKYMEFKSYDSDNSIPGDVYYDKETNRTYINTGYNLEPLENTLDWNSPSIISFPEYQQLSNFDNNRPYIITDVPNIGTAIPSNDPWRYATTTTYPIINDYVDACAPIRRHRRIYKRKTSHCPCCGGALPAMECNDSTELKCPYCDSMIDAVEIIDEEY